MVAQISTPMVIVIAVLAIGILYAIFTWNALVRLRMKVKEAFSGIDVQLKRRYDLIPNLVKTVKAYATHEKDTLEEVIQARGAAQETTDVEQRAKAENGLSRSLDKLIALVERYPELKADKNFRKLHEDLVHIEDDLQYARRYYNGTVRDLNVKVQQFPSNLVAGVLGVGAAEFFEVEDAGERHAPRIDWSE